LQEHGVGPAIATARRRWSVVAGIAAIVVAVDQLTKWWASQALEERDIDLFWTFRLRLTRNSGAAFSLARGGGGLVALAALVVVFFLIRAGRGAETKWGILCLGLVMGGAVGNLVDRAVRQGHGFLGGAVIDFIDPQWWPVFNVADVAISIGGVLLLLVAMRDAPDAPKSEAASSGVSESDA
jgi:signal peptidase II